MDFCKPICVRDDTAPELDIFGRYSGSKQNWRSLAKTFGSQLRTDVYALVGTLLIFAAVGLLNQDLRNHGTSPHSLVMDYATMASDITHFCQRHNLTNISLMGHSM